MGSRASRLKRVKPQARKLITRLQAEFLRANDHSVKFSFSYLHLPTRSQNCLLGLGSFRWLNRDAFSTKPALQVRLTRWSSDTLQILVEMGRCYHLAHRLLVKCNLSWFAGTAMSLQDYMENLRLRDS